MILSHTVVDFLCLAQALHQLYLSLSLGVLPKLVAPVATEKEKGTDIMVHQPKAFETPAVCVRVTPRSVILAFHGPHRKSASKSLNRVLVAFNGT